MHAQKKVAHTTKDKIPWTNILETAKQLATTSFILESAQCFDTVQKNRQYYCLKTSDDKELSVVKNGSHLIWGFIPYSQQ
jgi:hypothetical protein